MRNTAYFVYIIYSKKLDRYYIGCSKNPEKRLRYHKKGLGGGVKAYTRMASDWKLVWRKGFTTKVEALGFERKLKRMKSRKYIENLIGVKSYQRAASSIGRATGS